MKAILLILFLLAFSSQSFAYECLGFFNSIQKSEKVQNRELLNSLKRIRNFETFPSIVMINKKTERMTLLVFDLPIDGRVSERKSIDDHVQELRSFASEMKFIVEPAAYNQILMSRILKDPKFDKQKENLLFAKFNGSINLLENLKKSDSIQESRNFEIYQAVESWLSSSGALLNVLIIPYEARIPFITTASEKDQFVFKFLSDVIHQIDPNSI